MYNRLFKGDVCSHTQWYCLDNGFRRLLQNPVRIAGDYINPGDVVVDLGCGPGYFSVTMAELTGPSGTLIAVDLQPEMLEKVKQKALRKGLMDRMRIHRCSQTEIGLDGVLADFILAYYMVHETPDHRAFLDQVRSLLKPGGQCLLVEPLFHVSRAHFRSIVQDAVAAGFTIDGHPKGKGGRSVLLT